MANLIQFLNKTKTIDAKCEIIVNKILDEYSRGLIKTEVEMLYKLKQALKEFYSSIGKPTYKYISAKGTPISAHFNDMINKAYTDLKIMIEECENISNGIESSFVDIELSRKMLNNKIKYINKKIDDMKDILVINNEANITTFSDSFLNLDYAEIKTSGNGKIPAANINTTDGVLTLATTDNKLLSPKCKIDILDSSNGFPGNTHMIDVLDTGLHFVGYNNMRLDLNSMIDGNSDTWFEYELFNVDDKVLEQCGGLGFDYKEDISWITEDNKLKLILKLTLDVPSICNWLSLTPFVSENRGAKSSVITKVTISDENTGVQNINASKVFDDDTVILFTPQMVKSITIEIEQTMPYEVNIGHYYFTKANTINTMVFDDLQSSLYSRVDGVKPSVELLGMKYDPSTKKCIQPKNYNIEGTNSIMDSMFVKKSLFSTPTDSDKIKCSIEAIKAYRYFIGIKNISISNYQFVDTSEYMSKPFNTNDYIASITLEAEELIPKEFDDYIEQIIKNDPIAAEKQGLAKGQWIKYAISFDNGVEWQSIWPKHRAFQGPCTIKINSDTPENMRDTKNTVYVDRLIEPSSVRLKIYMLRPENEIYKTPVVFKYKLNILTGDENIEY